VADGEAEFTGWLAGAFVVTLTRLLWIVCRIVVNHSLCDRITSPLTVKASA